MKSIRVLALALLLLSACASTDRPRYTTSVDEGTAGSVNLTVRSDAGMSRDELRRALLTEAARQTIARGSVALRVDALHDSSSITLTPGVGTAEPQSASSSVRPNQTSEVNIGRHREGAIRFTPTADAPDGSRVFDASRLLDQLHDGTLPEALRQMH